MQFWGRISWLLRQLPLVDKTFIENVWTSLSYMSGQLKFSVQNALSSLSPDYIPVYRIIYWRKYESPWAVDSLVYSIPKLRDNVFNSYIEYIEGTDYNVFNEKIVWVSLGVPDGDMELAGVADWTQIGAPAIFAKDTVEQYSGTKCLKIAGDADEGVKSSAVTVTAEDWVRYSVYAKCTTDYGLELWDETNGAKIADLTDLTGSEYQQHEIIAKTPVDCISVTLRTTLGATGTLYLDDMDLTRYPQNAWAFAEQTKLYNPYLDTKLAYELRFLGINTSGYTPEHAHHLIRLLNYAYRSSDTYSSVKSGVTSVLGLPFAYITGTITKKETSGSNHEVTIMDGAGVECIVSVVDSVCALSDLPEVGAFVFEFEPLIADALKIREEGNLGFLPQTDQLYPVDGDMELYIENPTVDPVVSTVVGGTLFTGANIADNKGFDAGIGDWVQGSGGVLTSEAGGQADNGGRYVVGAVPSTTLPLLSAGLNDLIIGKDYVAEYYLKYDNEWTGGDVTLTVDGQTTVHTPTTSYVKKTLAFTAVGTASIISLTCASTPTPTSLFTGANAADNKGFDAGIGDWVQGSGGTLESKVGGQTGNGGRYTVNATPSMTLPLLSTGLDSLVAGKKYRISYYLKYETAWDGGDVSLYIDGQTVVHTPTTSYVKKTLEFTATGITPDISLTCSLVPTAADILWIDTFELILINEIWIDTFELTVGERTYYVKTTYTDGGETLESPQVSQVVPINNLLKVTSPGAQANATGWNVYVSEVSGSETKQDSLAIAVDWTEPADGLISGDALPIKNDTGLTNWSAINGAVLIKDMDEEYEQLRCLKITTNAVGEGFKPALNKAVSAGSQYCFSFYIKSKESDQAIVNAIVRNVDDSSIIISKWFGDITYEEGFLSFTVPSGCTEVRIEFETLIEGIFFVDIIEFNKIEDGQCYLADKVSDSVKASLTIAAVDRAGTKDLIFKSADHIYGLNGNYIKVEIVASGLDQELFSTIAGAGTVASPYVYTIITGTQADQSNNTAIRDFVNYDQRAVCIIVCESEDDSTADPTYSLVETALSGGVNAKVGTYSDVSYAVGDFMSVRNLGRQTKEVVKITDIGAGVSPYTKYISINKDLTEIYVSPETGTSTSVGAGFLTDNTKSWVADEHKQDKLVDSAGTEFKVSGNDGDTLQITGTPAAGAYTVLKDNVVVIYGNRDAGYITQATIYSRFSATYNQVNMDAFIDNINDKGHHLKFVDIS